jgi:hypothetical protein
VADLLAPKSMIVAVATGSLISDTHVSRQFKQLPDGSKVEIPGSRQSPGFAFFLTHPYQMAVGHPNLLLRPMAYDNGLFKGKKDDAILEWHEDIIRYALEDALVPASQFQLGIRVTAGGLGGDINDPKNVTRRCSGVLRRKKVGLCMFPDISSFWKPSNDTLNPPPAAKPGLGLKEPIQGTFDATMLGRMKVSP